MINRGLGDSSVGKVREGCEFKSSELTALGTLVCICEVRWEAGSGETQEAWGPDNLKNPEVNKKETLLQTRWKARTSPLSFTYTHTHSKMIGKEVFQ